MRLMTVQLPDGRRTVAAERDGEVVDVRTDDIVACATLPPDELVQLVADAPPIERYDVLPPVPEPRNVIAMALTYRAHATEMDFEVQPDPVVFAKFTNAVVGDGSEIEIPECVTEVDWEAELGVVIGRSPRDVSNPLDAVAGYTCINDVSSRSLQFAGVQQWTRSKSVDGFCPMGPALVTPDEVGDPQRLGIRCFVNGALMQDASTSEMVFGVAGIIEFLSLTMTLQPGDVIATGTPEGVAMGRPDRPYLGDGDEVVVEIDRVGRLTTRIRVPARRATTP